MSALITTYQIKGLNLDRFINSVQRRGITLYNVKKEGQNKLVLSVNFKDSKKFFAITKELCYNIEKIGDKGKALPLLSLIRNFGFIIGGGFFILLSIFFNDLIFSFSFAGSGSVLKKEVEGYLLSKGISAYSRFSKIDIPALEDEILSSHPNLSFVSCTKQGTKFKIELVLAEDEKGRLSGKEKQLCANVSGVVESIKVYRGTAQVNVGDVVREGDLIVDGYNVIREEKVETNVIACVTIVAEKEFLYRTNLDNQEEKAILFATESLLDREILNYSVTKIKDNQTFIYKVKMAYRCVLCVG